MAVPANGARRVELSWGRAGVAYDDYRRTGIGCGIAGATRDMSGQPAFGEVMHGFKTEDSIIDSLAVTKDMNQTLLDYNLVQRRTMHQQVPALQRYLVNGVERCLIAHGYRPFALTRDQAHALRKLPHGSEQRFRYLHHLAADPAILAAQAVALPAATPTAKP